MMSKKGTISFMLIMMVISPLKKTYGFQEACMIREGDHVYIEEGPVDELFSPGSTFKIPLSVMGFEEGIFQSSHTPKWPFKPIYKTWYETPREVCFQDHTPKSWITYSVIWFSQKLTKTLGMKKLQYYVDVFAYGNKDLSGHKGQNNGLTHGWLNSSLKISVHQQLDFLQAFISYTLPVSKKSQKQAQDLFYLKELPYGWKLYGKTGSSPMSCIKPGVGWFVGWISKQRRRIGFACVMELQGKAEKPYGLLAKDKMLSSLEKMLKQIEAYKPRD